MYRGRIWRSSLACCIAGASDTSFLGPGELRLRLSAARPPGPRAPVDFYMMPLRDQDFLALFRSRWWLAAHLDPWNSQNLELQIPDATAYIDVAIA